MKTSIVTEKTNKRIIHNNGLVEALKRYEASGDLGSQKAQLVFDHYKHGQAKLEKYLPYNGYKHFTPSQPKSCEICGYPVTSVLTKHHVIPQSKGGKYGKIVMLCPTCHCAIHMSVDRGEIDLGIVNYLEGTEGAVKKFGMYVRLCAEA